MAWLLLLAGLLAPAAAQADQGGYRIVAFHADLTVGADSTLLVEERLDVEFSEPRRGIYRTIPVRYTDPRGYAYSLGFRLLSAVDGDGRAHQAKVTNAGRYVKVRLGHPKRTVTGSMVYVLRYSIRRGVAHFAEHDELYWNVTGSEWLVGVESATATVHLPGIPAGEVQALGFTGRFGSSEQAVDVRQPKPGVITYTAARSLQPREGLTVVAAFPHGLVRFPGPATRVAWWLADNVVALVPLLTLGLLWRRWRRHGRDPVGPGSVMVRYEPPAGMTAAEMGTLMDERVHQRDINAAVVDLAVRGHLRIATATDKAMFGLVETEKVSFERLDRSQDDLLPHEHSLLDALFASGSWVDVDDLKEKFYTHLPGIKKKLYERLVQQKHFQSHPGKVRSRYVLYGFAAGLATLGAGVLLAILRGGIFPHAMGVPAAAAVLTALLLFIFAPAMPRRTRKGVAMRSWGLGFLEFVNRVEKENIEAAERRGVFEALLPYAMALGVAATWARRFEGIYAQGGPAWYAGSDPSRGFSTRGFEAGLSRAMSSTSQAMQSSPRSSGSSGSGGGGFSGGGGGGGGGGSW